VLLYLIQLVGVVCNSNVRTSWDEFTLYIGIHIIFLKGNFIFH
jgi:hypothetical protein